MKALAEADKIVCEMGYELDPDAVRVRYGEGWHPKRSSDQARAQGANFAEASEAPDLVAPEVDALLEVTAPSWQGMVAQVQALLAQSDDLAQVQQALLESYGQLDSAELVKLMAAAYALAQLKGMDAVQAEG